MQQLPALVVAAETAAAAKMPIFVDLIDGDSSRLVVLISLITSCFF